MTAPDTTPTVLAQLRPSSPRRVFGTAVLGTLAFVLIYMALRYPAAAFGWTLFLLAMGFGTLWMAWRLWHATAHGLILTAEALVATDGQVLAHINDVTAIDRGALAIKPAGGFTLVTRTAGVRNWAPGLWWRAGRRVGVGGVTHRHEGRFMAEQIAALLAARSPRD